MHLKDRHQQLIICGFMGTGKTAVGKLLAARLGRSFVDTDQLIEQQAGCTIAAIFEKQGESYFRDLETAVIRGLLSARLGSLVVATGGGALIKAENIKLLHQMGPLLLLTASSRAILRRIKAQGGRPLLDGVKNPKKTIEVLLAERADFYDARDYRFDTTGKTAKQVAGEIIKALDL
ncbi:MAG: shikimate kinase [Firmicutes bacterium]|nr:shikimate kinase [Bacillota bacterium]